MAYDAGMIAFMNSGWFWLILIWSGIWKGVSLWRSSRNKHLVWFVILFITSTLGILPIIYLLIFPKKKPVVKRKVVRKKTRKKTKRKKTTKKRK